MPSPFDIDEIIHLLLATASTDQITDGSSAALVSPAVYAALVVVSFETLVQVLVQAFVHVDGLAIEGSFEVVLPD